GAPLETSEDPPGSLTPRAGASGSSLPAWGGGRSNRPPPPPPARCSAPPGPACPPAPPPRPKRRLAPPRRDRPAATRCPVDTLAFEYRARSTDAPTRRLVSPQRLTHYRDNWYLDAWDHEREALRSFALDRIRQPRPGEARARDLPEAELDQHLASSYGIFSGA